MAGATSRVSRVLTTGPLAPFAEAYRRELRERGYTERSAVNQLRQVARFSRWLQAGHLSVPELGAGLVEEFLGVAACPSGVTGPNGRVRGWRACFTCSRQAGGGGGWRAVRAGSAAEVLLAPGSGAAWRRSGAWRRAPSTAM